MRQKTLSFVKEMKSLGQVKEQKEECEGSLIVENTASTPRILQRRIIFDSDDEFEVPQLIESPPVLSSPSPLPTVTRASATQLETERPIFIVSSTDMTTQPPSLPFDINGDADET